MDSQDNIVEVSFHQNYHDKITIRVDDDSWVVNIENIITGCNKATIGACNVCAGVKINYNEAYKNIKELYPNLPDFTFNE